jgi:hypothetical protein
MNTFEEMTDMLQAYFECEKSHLYFLKIFQINVCTVGSTEFRTPICMPLKKTI